MISKQVAVGVVVNAQEQVLMTQRSLQQDCGGLWEFPGGKLEPGETSYVALCRELQEEVAIQVEQAEPLLSVKHTYEQYAVVLHVWQVSTYRGEPVAQEGQPMQWVPLAELSQRSIPAANAAIVEALIACSKPA